MKKVTVISHLTPEEWKRSWDDKVVNDKDKQAVKASRLTDCFWGHFQSDNEFILSHHKDGEARGISISLYFWGKIEPEPRGCKITGSFGRSLSTNIFLIGGSILLVFVIYAAGVMGDTEMTIVATALLLVLLLIYFIRPKSNQEVVYKKLEAISFDDDFHKGGKKYKRKRKVKTSMKDKAKAMTEAEENKIAEEQETASQASGSGAIEDKQAAADTPSEDADASDDKEQPVSAAEDTNAQSDEG